jgi:hypothetical protein
LEGGYVTGSKEELMREAARLGHDYLAKYKGVLRQAS